MTSFTKNDIKRRAIRDIDKTKTLTQEDLNRIFSKIRVHIEHCLFDLIDIGKFPQLKFLDLGCTVFLGADRNRSIFKKSAATSDDYIEGKSREDHGEELFCHAMDMSAALLANDKNRQKSIIRSNNIMRSLFESIVKEWLKVADKYCSIAEQSTLEYTKGDISKHSSLEVELLKLEILSLTDNPVNMYGVCKTVERRMKAVQYLSSKVFEAYTRIVLQTAKYTAGSDAQENDSYQNGAFGLMKAVSYYDHCSYLAFPNFAKMWIKQAILFSLKDEANTVHVPVNVWQQFSNIERLQSKMEAKYGQLTTEELADKIGFKKDYVATVCMTIRAAEMRSIDKASSSQEGEGTQNLGLLSNFIDEADIDHKAAVLVYDKVKNILEHMSYYERLVVCLRFGLFEFLPEKPVTDELKSFFTLREKVRQSYLV